MRTKAQQAQDYVIKAIESGQWQPGDKLPSERALATTLGLSPVTLRRGLEELAEEGVIIKKPGSGNFVADPSKTTSIAVVFPSYLLSDQVHQPIVSLEMHALEQVLDRHRYALSLLWYRPGCFQEDVGKVILSRNIKGLVLWGQHLLKSVDIQPLLDQGVQIVGRTSALPMRQLGLSTFALDRSAIQAAALLGLKERGHKNVVVVRYINEDTAPNHNAGEPLASQSNVPEMTISQCLCVAKHWKVDFSNLDAIFDQKPLCTAVVVPDEIAANEFFRRCYRRGIRIPDDISLVASNDVSPHTHPVPLSAPDSVHWANTLSHMAGEQLLKLLKNEPAPCMTTMLIPPIVWRESVMNLTKNPKENEFINESLLTKGLESSDSKLFSTLTSATGESSCDEKIHAVSL